MRLLYTILFYLALPFIFLRLLWRSKKEVAYRLNFSERLGFYQFKLSNCIWIHAVSMGETIAATPFIRELHARYPDATILVTNMTPSGAARVKSTFSEKNIVQAYLPYDLPDAVARFLNQMQPRIAIIMETEIWPNLIAGCQQRQIPVCLINARLSEKSAKGYQKVAALTKAALQGFDLIASHAKKDAERFISLGAPANKVVVSGSLKFDLKIADDLQQKAQSFRQTLESDGKRFIWIAASTHPGEEEIILAAQAKLYAQHPECLLILVPRHSSRFNEIADLAAKQFKVVRRSAGQACALDVGVFLGDTMGEMMLMYAAGDAALVGGSLIPRGGHNILEPAALAKPLLSGPHLFNFAEISELFIERQALQIVSNADQISAAIEKLMASSTLAMSLGDRAFDLVEANKGALNKQIQAVCKLIPT